jgi:DNA-binding MarR family transcriptional regulator
MARILPTLALTKAALTIIAEATNIQGMSDTDTPQVPPASGGAERRPADFYRAETYQAEESIGYLMRRILSAVAQAVETRMCEPGSPTFPQWLPLYKLHIGAATTVAELARACELDTGAMTRLLDRLEAKGLCRRVRSLEDRRGSAVRAQSRAERTPGGFHQRGMGAAQGLSAPHPRQRAGPCSPWRKK